MAAKMRCPSCNTMCRIEYDIDKEANGIYVVHDLEDGRYLECTMCEDINKVWDWEEHGNTYVPDREDEDRYDDL